MALVSSTMVPLGSPASQFTLPDGLGRWFSITDVMGKDGLLVVFICNHCPFVRHLAGFLQPLHDQLTTMGIGMVAINANDVIYYPDDAPEKMVAFAQQQGFNFPYLFDETQAVARQYDAVCTPDFFLYDQALRLFYRGQLDDSRPGNHRPIDGKDLLAAAAALRQRTPYSASQIPSVGCNIKWKLT